MRTLDEPAAPQDADEIPPSSCRPHFRLRTLLMALTAIAVALGIAHHEDRNIRLARALILASRHDDTWSVWSLVRAGADVDARDGGPALWTPLMYASDRGELALVRFLLDQGATIDLQDGDGFTALTLAAEHGYWDVAKLLAERGADVHYQDATGHSALSRARKESLEDVAAYLVSKARTKPRPTPHTNPFLSSKTGL